MATLLVSYAPGTGYTSYKVPDYETNITKRGQVFLCDTANAEIESVQFKLFRSGTPGTFNVELYAVDGSNHPTGDALSSGSYNGNILTTGTTGLWTSISMSAYTMSSGTSYALVIDPINAISPNYVGVKAITLGEYADGGSLLLIDSNWTYIAGVDLGFKVYISDSAPEKPINPTPENEASGITLDGTTVTWEDGGGATSYNVYYGTLSGFLTLLEAGVTDLSYTLRNTNWPSYDQAWYWRIDAVNDVGTTTGDEWYFTTLVFYPPTPPGITWDDPGNDSGYTGSPTGENNMVTLKRLVAAAQNTIWYEDI